LSDFTHTLALSLQSGVISIRASLVFF